MEFGIDLLDSPPRIRHRRQAEEEPQNNDENFNADCCRVAALDQIVAREPEPMDDFQDADVVVVQRQGARQSRRVAQNGLRSAFQEIVNGEYDDFLQRPVIQKLFEPAFEAFTKFGQGHGADQVENHWNLYWTDHLKQRDAHVVHFALISLVDENPDNRQYKQSLKRFEKDLADSHCLFCRLRRNLSICTYDTSGDAPVYLGLIGADCWNIRFQPLIDLIDTCRSLALSIDHPDFELIDRRHLNACLTRIIEAPAVMAEAYQHLRK